MRAGGAGAQRLAASPWARSSAAHLRGPTMRIRITATGMVPLTATVIRLTTAMAIRRTTAMAIRRTTATETGIITATTPDVTDERLRAPIKEHGRENPCAAFSVRLLFCALLGPHESGFSVLRLIRGRPSSGVLRIVHP